MVLYCNMVSSLPHHFYRATAALSEKCGQNSVWNLTYSRDEKTLEMESKNAETHSLPTFSSCRLEKWVESYCQSSHFPVRFKPLFSVFQATFQCDSSHSSPRFGPFLSTIRPIFQHHSSHLTLPEVTLPTALSRN